MDKGLCSWFKHWWQGSHIGELLTHQDILSSSYSTCTPGLMSSNSKPGCGGAGHRWTKTLGWSHYNQSPCWKSHVCHTGKSKMFLESTNKKTFPWASKSDSLSPIIPKPHCHPFNITVLRRIQLERTWNFGLQTLDGYPYLVTCVSVPSLDFNEETGLKKLWHTLLFWHSLIL